MGELPFLITGRHWIDAVNHDLSCSLHIRSVRTRRWLRGAGMPPVDNFTPTRTFEGPPDSAFYLPVVNAFQCVKSPAFFK